MMQSDTAAGVTAAPPAAKGDIALGAAIADLIGDLRGLLSDAAEVVAAESQAALRRVLVMAVSALGAALLVSLGVVAVLAAMASELVSRGLSLAAALLCVAAVCALMGMFLWGIVTRISRQASFANSRRMLRGSV